MTPDEAQEERQRLRDVAQRSFSGESESNSIFGTFFSTPGRANGTQEAVPKLPELPNEAFMPGSPFSTSRTLKPSRCRCSAQQTPTRPAPMTVNCCKTKPPALP